MPRGTYCNDEYPGFCRPTIAAIAADRRALLQRAPDELVTPMRIADGHELAKAAVRVGRRSYESGTASVVW